MQAGIRIGRTASVVLVALTVGLWSGVGSAGAVDPTTADIQVNITSGPQVTVPQTPDPTGCIGVYPGPFTCTKTGTLSQDAMTLTGTVSYPAKSLAGTIAVTCSWKVDWSASITIHSVVGPPDIMITAFTGTGTQTCTWVMTFSDASTLNGTIDGTMAMSLVPSVTPETLQWGGEFSVTVIGGTGTFAGMVGTGTFSESEQVPFPTAGTLSQHSVARAAALATGDGSSMHLSLVPGASKVTFLYPSKNGQVIKRKAKTPLSLQTVVGAKCTAKATSGKRKVALGSASDGTVKDGKVTFKSGLAKSLKVGTWKITASCTVGTTKASGTRTIKVK